MATVDVDKTTPMKNSLDAVTSSKRAKEDATDDFIQSLLNASAAGASQRVIGDAAGLSHARIGQIIREYRRSRDGE